MESTTEQYYIAVRKKIVENGETKQVVMVPAPVKKEQKKEPYIPRRGVTYVKFQAGSNQ